MPAAQGREENARICPLCLGILQAPDSPRPLRMGAARIALPDMDASGGEWRLLPTGDIAAIAAAARHASRSRSYRLLDLLWRLGFLV